MARVLLLGYNLTSVFNGGLAIARRLVRRGHTVRVVGFLDLEKKVRDQGLEFVPFLEQVYPKGRLEALDAAGKTEKAPPFKRIIQDMKDEMEAFAGGDLLRATEGFEPDAVIACADHPIAAIAAGQLKRPLFAYLTKPFSRHEQGEPPLGSPLVPSDSVGYRLQNYLAWKGHTMAQTLLVRGFLRWNYREAFRAYAARMDFDPEKVAFDVDYTLARPRIPHLVLWPRQMEFARTQEVEDVYYLESAVDTERTSDATFSWEGFDPAKPLVYCSLGVTGTVHHPGRLRPIFHQFLAAMEARPQWEAILSIGEHEELEQFKVPPNVRVFRRVPQIDVLRRAQLFVTQGGAVSLSEAFALGVPMVLVPLFYDQWGLTARVVTHGLGVRANEGKMTPELLGASMDRVLGDPEFLARARAVAGTLREMEARGRTAEVVEALLAGQKPSAS